MNPAIYSKSHPKIKFSGIIDLNVKPKTRRKQDKLKEKKDYLAKL